MDGLGARVLDFEGNSFGVFKSRAGSSPADSVPLLFVNHGGPRHWESRASRDKRERCDACFVAGQFEPGTGPPTQVVIVTICAAIRLLADPVPACHTRPPNAPQMEIVFRTWPCFRGKALSSHLQTPFGVHPRVLWERSIWVTSARLLRADTPHGCLSF